MKKALVLVGLLLLALTFLPLAGATSHNVSSASLVGAAPVPAPVLTPRCEDSFDEIGHCPDTGCGDRGDALLNQAKNRSDSPLSTTNFTLNRIRAKAQPSQWDTGQPRTSIQGPGKEGSGVAVSGFLLKAKPGSGESCNCGLTRRVDTDVHFVLVSDMEDAEKTSVTAEVTPRVRKDHHPDWSFRNLNDLEGEYIRVKGFLMLDTKHMPQAHRLRGEPLNRGLERATNWEIHPVTQIWKCTKSKSSCDRGTGWEEVP
jgi:hypothetical protein